MRIRISGGKMKADLTLPTRMMFSKPALVLYRYIGKRYTHSGAEQVSSVFDNLPDSFIRAACDVLAAVKEENGSWELLQIESADGEKISITI